MTKELMLYTKITSHVTQLEVCFWGLLLTSLVAPKWWMSLPGVILAVVVHVLQRKMNKQAIRLEKVIFPEMHQ